MCSIVTVLKCQFILQFIKFYIHFKNLIGKINYILRYCERKKERTWTDLWYQSNKYPPQPNPYLIHLCQRWNQSHNTVGTKNKSVKQIVRSRNEASIWIWSLCMIGSLHLIPLRIFQFQLVILLRFSVFCELRGTEQKHNLMLLLPSIKPPIIIWMKSIQSWSARKDVSISKRV